MKLRGGMAAKRGRKVVSNDFSIKADDAEVIKMVLAYRAPDYKTFTGTLTEQDCKRWSEFCLRQKNFDRIIEFTMAELKIKRDFEDRTQNKIIIKEINENKIQ